MPIYKSISYLISDHILLRFDDLSKNSAYNRLQACIHDAIEPKCGAEAMEVAESFTKATFSRIPKISCAKYEHNGKQCAALLPQAGSVPKGAKSHSVLSRIFSTYANS